MIVAHALKEGREPEIELARYRADRKLAASLETREKMWALEAELPPKA